MIKSIKLSNFFSFQQQTIHLHNSASVLIGINGSGKSNLLKAILLLKLGVEGNSEGTALRQLFVGNWGGFDNVFCKSQIGGQQEHSIGLEFTLDKSILSKYANSETVFESDVLYKILIIRKASIDNYFISEKITGNGRTILDFYNGQGQLSDLEDGNAIPGNYEGYEPQELALSNISEFDKDRYLPLVVIKKAIREIAVYNHFDTSPSSKLRRAMSATSGHKRLLPDGSNLPQIINAIKIKAKLSFQEIRSKFLDVNEMFAGFDFNMLGSGLFELMLDERELSSSIHIAHVSDGTLRFLCLLAILCNPDRGSLVCIDEPEMGLHPDMIQTITKSLHEASKETPFLVASHSENVVNQFGLEHIRVFEKDEANRTIVKQFNKSDFEGWYEHYRSYVASRRFGRQKVVRK